MPHILHSSWHRMRRRSTEVAPSCRVDSMNHQIRCHYLSQEDLLRAGCLDMKLAMDAAEAAMLAYRAGEVLFPEKIVQIFDEGTQERINCLPATFRKEKVCGVKWVSVFPPNPVKFGLQNLSAVIVLSEIERGFPIAFMEGTLCSNMRVGAMGALAAKHLARAGAERIGFIGSGEQAKMHLIAMKAAVPSLRICTVGAKTAEEEEQFVREMSPILPDMAIAGSGTDLAGAAEGADIIVTATSAQGSFAQARVGQTRGILQPRGWLGGRLRSRETIGQDRMRRLGDREAPHADALSDVQGRRAGGF